MSDRNVQNSNNGDSGSDDLNNDNGQWHIHKFLGHTVTCKTSGLREAVTHSSSILQCWWSVGWFTMEKVYFVA